MFEDLPAQLSRGRPNCKNLQFLHQQVYINLLHDYKGLSSVCTILNRKLKFSHLRFVFLHKKASMKVAHIMINKHLVLRCREMCIFDVIIKNFLVIFFLL